MRYRVDVSPKFTAGLGLSKWRVHRDGVFVSVHMLKREAVAEAKRLNAEDNKVKQSAQGKAAPLTSLPLRGILYS